MIETKASFSFIIMFLLTITTLVVSDSSQCLPCYYSNRNQNCQSNGQQPFLLHMSVHPHLDAFWIFDFQDYYQPSQNDPEVLGYFQSNRFSSVQQIFDTALSVLAKSQKYRELMGQKTQKAKRTFFNSQMGFFKHWYTHLNPQKQMLVKQLLHSSYWEILGGAFVEHDEGCAYYEDIIENFQIGLHFLKKQLNYIPKIAISADSFGHSQSTVAILAHLGMEGFFVQRSDEHILEQSKTEFIWRASSTNNITYGALPTHIRWAIHGFQDQFIQTRGSGPLCLQKQQFIEGLRMENRFLKKILKSTHAMRYFGHDFQEFKQEHYDIIESIMEQFSREKCENVAAVYTNPTQYFKILMSQVFNKAKPVAYRNQDIFPIWDYDSGLYWTGYYTTDPYHKKFYRDCGRFLHAVRKAFFISYIEDPKANYTINSYNSLQQFAETVAYLQHHDGISGTSKYKVLDKYESLADQQQKQLTNLILNRVFEDYYPLYTTNPVLVCGIFNQCVVPQGTLGNVFVKIFNSGTRPQSHPIIIQMPQNQFYQTDCKHEIICMCFRLPCKCQIYLYPQVFTFTEILLRRVQSPQNIHFLKKSQTKSSFFQYNQTHITLHNSNGGIEVGYKQIKAQPTKRQYDHLSRYGHKQKRTFIINSGKYALGNNPNKISQLSKIKSVMFLQTSQLKKIMIAWKRENMKTVISSTKLKNTWKIETYSAAEAGKLQDLYVQFASKVSNGNKFYTDSNGWLTMQRRLNTHQDYKAYFPESGFDNINGNTYPMTSFAYIEDNSVRLSVNTDRPQGVISYHEGKLWVHFDRLTSDDGKWVHETTYRSQYQKFVHYVTIDNKIQGNPHTHRTIQQIYDQPLIIQINDVQPNTRFQKLDKNKQERYKWVNLTAIQDTKFWLRTWNDSSVTLRIQNIYDDKNITVGLFASKISQFLTSYYGNSINFTQIEEMSLGGNMGYGEFLSNKWNWNREVDLKKQNAIFNKKFSQKIQLRPLEIRTFRIKGIGLGSCTKLNQLIYSGQTTSYEFDLSKNPPTRPPQNHQNQKALKQYLQYGDHCKAPSPILNKQAENQINVKYDVIQQTLRQPGSLITKNDKRKIPQWIIPLIQQQKLPKIQQNPQKTQTKNRQKQLPQSKREKYVKEQNPKKPTQLLSCPLNYFNNDSSKQLSEICHKIASLKILSADQKQRYFVEKKKTILSILSKENAAYPV